MFRKRNYDVTPATVKEPPPFKPYTIRVLTRENHKELLELLTHVAFEGDGVLLYPFPPRQVQAARWLRYKIIQFRGR